MDQLKDFLRQAIRHRFWIAVGLSAIFSGLAYFLGSGPIQQQAVAKTAAIDSAYKGVKVYAQGKPINKQYSEIVTSKTEDLTKEVDESWKKLYDRQAPLLTWPELVEERFNAWGRQWPKDIDASAVQIAIIEYVNTYPKFVTQVYKSFHPFDPESGTGVVAAPPEVILLRPAGFSESNPPGLGKVWSAQERLWIQRTMLDVIAKVNRDAKTWDTAIIKQIKALEVGNSLAQDQRSIAKGETLEESPDIVDPAAPPPADTSSSSSSASPAAGSSSPSLGSAYGGSVAAAPLPTGGESVFFIKSESPAIKILPVQMTVLIDQDHIQDLLVALENSPMTIQVRDFEMYKPLTAVTKPEKGTQVAYGMGMGMGMGMGGYNPMMANSALTGYGPRMAQQQEASASLASMYNTTGGMTSGGAAKKSGVDLRSKDFRKENEERLNAAKGVKGTSIHNPYFNIVEVKVYGQARFFNPPPTPPPVAPSQSENAAATPAPAEGTPASADAEKKADDQPKADAEKKADDQPKADAEKKAEPAKADDEMKAEPAKAEDQPKADAEKKAEPAKADAAEKKDTEPEPKKAEPKKAEPAKADDGAMSPK